MCLHCASPRVSRKIDLFFLGFSSSLLEFPTIIPSTRVVAKNTSVNRETYEARIQLEDEFSSRTIDTHRVVTLEEEKKNNCKFPQLRLFRTLVIRVRRSVNMIS